MEVKTQFYNLILLSSLNLLEHYLLQENYYYLIAIISKQLYKMIATSVGF